jgi:hypothetical protein
MSRLLIGLSCLGLHFGGINDNYCFMPDSIQMIIDIVMLGCGPNIHVEL